MLYTEDCSMRHYVGFLQIGPHIEFDGLLLKTLLMTIIGRLAALYSQLIS